LPILDWTYETVVNLLEAFGFISSRQLIARANLVLSVNPEQLPLEDTSLVAAVLDISDPRAFSSPLALSAAQRVAGEIRDGREYLGEENVRLLALAGVLRFPLSVLSFCDLAGEADVEIPLRMFLA